MSTTSTTSTTAAGTDARISGSGTIATRATRGIRMAALALAAAALPALALAEETWNPQEQARVERLIEQVIQGNGNAGQQETAKSGQPAQQGLQHAAMQATRSAGMGEATRPQVR